jgi:L-fuconate dehydratase
MVKITGFETHGVFLHDLMHLGRCLTVVTDVRFPTSLTGDGTDAMYVAALLYNLISLKGRNRNTDCDYSSAYVTLFTDGDLVGHGMTFTIGRGNDIVS